MRNTNPYSPSARASALGAISAITALAFIVAGCAVVDDPSTPTDGSGADVVAAQALVDEYSQPMTSLNLPPLTKKPDPDKTVVFVTNNQPGSVLLNDAGVTAAEALGWTAIPIVYDAAAATGVTAAFAQAVELMPDAVVTNSIDATGYAQAAAELAELGIPVVVSSTSDEVTDPIIANVSGRPLFELAGRLTAAYAIAQHGDDTSAAMFNVQSFPILDVYQAGFEKEYEKLCPDCEYEVIPVQFGDIGTKIPTQVVSAVQRNPEINVAVMGFNALSTGVAGALSGAALSGIDIIGLTPTMANLTSIVNGTEHMWVALPLETQGWKSVDALARYFNGEDVEIATTTGVPVQIMTADNVTDPPVLPELVDMEATFKKLWLVD